MQRRSLLGGGAALLLVPNAVAQAAGPELAPDPGGDDTEAFRRRAGQCVWLRAGATYRISGQIRWPAGSRSAGFAVRGGGRATIVVRGEAWNNVSSQGRGGARSFSLCAFYAQGAGNPIFRGIHVVLEPAAGLCMISPLAMRDCQDVEIDYAFSGFKEAAFGYTSIDSCTVKSLKVEGRDCNPNSTTLPRIDITVVELDDNRIGGRNTVMSPGGMPWQVTSRNVCLGPEARARYSEQSNGLRLSGRGHQGIVATVDCENIGQVVDCWSDDNRLTIRFRNAYVAPFCDKFGGSGNVVDIQGSGVGLYGVFISGYAARDDPSRTQSGSNNHITARIDDIGALHDALPHAGPAFGILIDGGSDHAGWTGTHPEGNSLTGILNGGGGATTMVAAIGNAHGAGRNSFTVQASNYREVFAKHTADSPPPDLGR